MAIDASRKTEALSFGPRLAMHKREKLLAIAEGRTDGTAGKVSRTHDEARADLFDFIERFYNPLKFETRLPQPDGVRDSRYTSLTSSPRNQ